MPSIQDEEESLCLLASDLQDMPREGAPSDMPESQNWRQNSNSSVKDDWIRDHVEPDKPPFLSQGTAEKAFFNVCKTNEDEEDEDEEEEDEDDDVEVCFEN